MLCGIPFLVEVPIERPPGMDLTVESIPGLEGRVLVFSVFSLVPVGQFTRPPGRSDKSRGGTILKNDNKRPKHGLVRHMFLLVAGSIAHMN